MEKWTRENYMFVLGNVSVEEHRDYFGRANMITRTVFIATILGVSYTTMSRLLKSCCESSPGYEVVDLAQRGRLPVSVDIEGVVSSTSPAIAVP